MNFADTMPHIVRLADSKALAQKALEMLIDDARKAVKTKDDFKFAISGGGTPRRFFELIGTCRVRSL